MTWFDRLEERRTLLISGVIAICVATLALAVRRKPVDYDSFWHLQTGLDWIYNGLSPWVDHYSFTFAGQAISSQPVAFQALLAYLVDTLGLEAGSQAIKLIAFLLVVGLMAAFLKKLRSPAVIYLLIFPLLVLLLELRAVERPELFSYTLSIIAVMLYHRARGRATLGSVLPIALLMFVWTNYHSSVLGYILFFGFFVDAAFLQFRERADAKVWLGWLLGGLFVLAVGTLNKGFHIPVIGSINFSSEYVSFIQEYRAPTYLKSIIGIYSLIAMVLAVLYLAVKQRKFGYVIVTLIFSYYSVKMGRLVTPCGIIILGLFASLVSEVDVKSTIERQSYRFRQVTGIGLGLAVLAGLYSSVTLARGFMQENRTSELNRPERVVAYMQEKNLSGRIFNEYGRGGFLIHKLTPEVKVYIDGRTGILYTPEHLRRYRDALNSPEVLREEIEKYDINLALLESDRSTYAVVQEAGLLGLDFADHKFSLFTRDNPNFPVTGELLGNPACWNETQEGQIEAEFATAILTLPADSSILPILAFMLQYSTQPDKPTFLTEFAASQPKDEMLLRFAAYQALSVGLYEISASLFERIEIWEHREFLAAALAYTKLEKWEKAEQVIDTMNIVVWPHVAARDTALQYGILETIRREKPLNLISDSYVNELKNNIDNDQAVIEALSLDPELLCSS